jgi:DNA repair protein RecO (recombination protein O)
MEWNDTALVLQTGQFREADLWVRLFSQSRGVFTAFAFGGSRSRRRFCGCLDVFNVLSCRCKTTAYGKYVNLEEAVLLRAPQRLRTDWSRMGLAVNCARFAEALGIGSDSAAGAYAVFIDLLRLLEGSAPLPVLLPLFFRLRMASEIGFAPALHQCAACGKAVQGAALFLVNEGLVRCEECGGGSSPYAVPLPAAGLALLQAVQQQSPTVWGRYALSLPIAERRACARAIDGFVQYHLGIAWEEGRFRKV